MYIFIISNSIKLFIADANKFGQKMLEKMGWQQGKGLGAHENGITENIKVSYKNDSQGKIIHLLKKCILLFTV